MYTVSQAVAGNNCTFDKPFGAFGGMMHGVTVYLRHLRDGAKKGPALRRDNKEMQALFDAGIPYNLQPADSDHEGVVVEGAGAYQTGLLARLVRARAGLEQLEVVLSRVVYSAEDYESANERTREILAALNGEKDEEAA